MLNIKDFILFSGKTPNNNNYLRPAEEVGYVASPDLNVLSLEVVSQCPQPFSLLLTQSEVKMEHQQFSEMEMPTQSSPNHSQHHHPSQHYHHHQQHHQPNSQVSAGSSGTARISSQSGNITTSNPMNPNNSLTGIASSSHCVSSSSSSPPPTSASSHGYASLPTSGSQTPPGTTHCVAETNYNSSSCYNNNNNSGGIMTPGSSSLSGVHCSHLPSSQQHLAQNYLQGNMYSYNWKNVNKK